MLVGNVQHLGELPGVHRRGADRQRFAGANDVVQCCHDFLRRHGRVEAVNLIQIDIIELQPLQTGIDRMADVFARQSAIVGGVSHRLANLGGDDDLFARDFQFAQGAAEDFFTHAVGVNVGRVEKIDARFPGAADERPAGFFLQHPRPPFGAAVGHHAQAKPRNLGARATEIDVFHRIPPRKLKITCRVKHRRTIIAGYHDKTFSRQVDGPIHESASFFGHPGRCGLRRRRRGVCRLRRGCETEFRKEPAIAARRLEDAVVGEVG